MFLTRYTITIKPNCFFYALEETVVSPIKEMLMFRGLDVWKTSFDTLESLSQHGRCLRERGVLDGLSLREGRVAVSHFNTPLCQNNCGKIAHPI